MANIIYLPSALGAIETGRLYGIENDTETYVHADTGVIASVTGEPVSSVRNAARLVLFGSGWVNRPRPQFVGAMSDTAIEESLRVLGYIGQWHDAAARPTLAAYLKNRTHLHKTHPCIVGLTDRRVAICGDLYCDLTNRDRVIDVKNAPSRRERVTRVFVVSHRILPMPIPQKELASNTSAPAAQEDLRLAKKMDRLFRHAIRAETEATRVKITDDDVFILSADHVGWYWIGSLDSVRDSLLEPHAFGYLRGRTDEAAAYRRLMDY